MKRAMHKDFLREIKGTRSRFFSIMVLVALSVAFLSGLKATAPDMKGTGDDYLDSLHLADVQVLSTLGLTQDDIDALRARGEVEAAEGAYVLDAFASSAAADTVVKVYSLSEAGINDVLLREGRLPARADECVAEEGLLNLLGISLGDTLSLDPPEEQEDMLAGKCFTVVGIIRSPVYLSVERGTSTIGSGTVKGYLYLPRAAFSSDYYTAAYLRIAGAAEMTAFYDDYDDYIDAVIDSLEPFGEERAALRYNTLIGDADEELTRAQRELDEAKAEADEELADAAQRLSDARQELDEGWRDYRSGLRELSNSRKALDDAKQQLADGEQEYADGLAEYESGLRDYEQGQSDYEKGLAEYEDGKQKLDAGSAELLSGKTQLDAGQKQLDALGSTLSGAFAGSGSPYEDDPNALLDALGSGDDTAAAATDAALAAMRAQLQGGIEQIESGIAEIDAGLAQIDSAIAGIDAALEALEQLPPELAAAQRPALEAQRSALVAQRGELTAQRTALSSQLGELQAQLSSLSALSAESIGTSKRELDSGLAQYRRGQAQLSEGYRDLADGKRELDDAKSTLDKAAQTLSDAKADLAAARQELDNGWAEYRDGEAQYADGERTLRKAYADLSDGEQEYADGLAEYEDGKREADEKIGDAQKTLDDARRDIADIDAGEWYIFSRSYNPGYTGFGQDAERMANLASVFPMIFFLVAALVCLTTMTRMVEEQRVQIGSLKALGYSRLAISAKYIGYGLLPSFIGSVVGLAIGYTLFPKMIFTAYQIMYEMPNLELRAYADISAFSILAAVACTTLSTLWACLSTLREAPASLMRPRAPKAGKRVVLEYIRPLWKRMSFIHKVTARNLFRYQKRFWMTVIGIGGCTALIIAGFGLRSSLLYTMSRQYDDLFHYSAQVTLSDSAEETERSAVEDFLAYDARIIDSIPCAASSATAISDSYSLSAYVEVMAASDLPKAIELYDFESGETLTMQDTGVYLDQKLAELLELRVGDEVFLDGDKRANVTVAGIYEHYTGHFIYMTPAYYAQAFGETATENSYLLNFTSDDPDTCNAIFEKLLSFDGVVSTSRMRDTQDTYTSSMERVDFVVVIVIFAAAALAVVVLYNLSNINITERQRELATIKLLGFYDGEVSAYVYRENIVLTILGIALGILLGHWLHTYLVLSTEIDLMMFGRETDPTSYLYAAILTALFSFLVNLISHFKLKKIDMVESLKSAE